MMDNIHLPPLTAVADREESLAAFQMLKECLQKDAQVFPDHFIGWQGGRRRHTVYWLRDFEFWAVLEQSPPPIKKGPRHRFWNCFGIHSPQKQQTLRITVEINPPHEGENRRIGGLFAQDAENRIYIAHTGKVGGGREGIGQKAFRKYFQDLQWQEIATLSGRQTALVLGPIDGADFRKELADFVHKVAEFKSSGSKIK